MTTATIPQVPMVYVCVKEKIDTSHLYNKSNNDNNMLLIRVFIITIYFWHFQSFIVFVVTDDESAISRYYIRKS